MVLVFVLVGRSSPASRAHVVAPFRRASASRPRVTGVAAKIADLVVTFFEERCIFFRVGEEARSKLWRQMSKKRNRRTYLFIPCAKKIKKNQP